jgi:glycosyltransferase involved in cell wall biosynthesis
VFDRIAKRWIELLRQSALNAPRWSHNVQAAVASTIAHAEPLRARLEGIVQSASAPHWSKDVAYRSLVALTAAAGEDAAAVGELWLPFVANSSAAHRALARCYLTQFAIVRPMQLMQLGRMIDGSAASKETRLEQQTRWLSNGLTWNTGAAVVPIDSIPNRVAYIAASTLPYHSAGYGARTHGLVQALQRRGWDIHVVARPGYPNDRWDYPHWALAPSQLDIDGVPYCFAPTRNKLRFARDIEGYHRDAADTLETQCRQLRPALLHAASNYNCGLLASEVARRLDIPIIYEVRGFWHVSKAAEQPNYQHSDHFRMIHGFETQVANAAAHVFAITSGIADELAAAGVDSTKITMLPNAADVSRWKPMAPDEILKQRYRLGDHTVIGYVGSLHWYEGIDDLLTAAARLRQQHPLSVIIVGDGAQQSVLQQQAQQLGIADVVHFVGRVLPSQVADYYSIIDIIALPRKPIAVCELVSPLKPFEAMAMQRAVVASNVAAQADIVQDGVTGRLFAKGSVDDLARVLDELIADPAQRIRLGAAASQWVTAERSWDKIAGSVDEVYRRLGAK